MLCSQGERYGKVTLVGWAWFCHRGMSAEAAALVDAAGVAWDLAVNERPSGHSSDADNARAQCSSRHGYETMVKAAAAILATRMREHALVTRALLEGDLDAERIAALVHGDRNHRHE